MYTLICEIKLVCRMAFGCERVKGVVVNNLGSRTNFIHVDLNFMKILKKTSILVVFLFSYIVRKALFDWF
jgi:hypothetical protein